MPVFHELHDLVFVEHDPPRGRPPAGEEHPPFRPLPMLAGPCDRTSRHCRGSAIRSHPHSRTHAVVELRGGGPVPGSTQQHAGGHWCRVAPGLRRALTPHL